MLGLRGGVPCDLDRDQRQFVFVQRPVSLILISVVVAVLVLPRLAKRWSARRLPA